MATSTTSNLNCIRCTKSIGTFTCRGCDGNFCLTHANEHRQMLSIQMDEEIIPLHDHLQDDLLQQMKNSSNHPLMQHIDKWEKDSIEIVQQTAVQLRKDLMVFIEKPITEIKKQLEDLTQQLKTARNDDHFFENDLKHWIHQLNQLSNQLKIPSEISLKPANNDLPLISKISIEYSNERFEQPIGNIHILENGLKIVHNDTNTYASTRGLKDYSHGEHHLQFLIENLTNNWMFLGIISKTSPIPYYPSVGKTAYGWSGLNNVWRDGNRTTNFDNYRSDFQNNDRIDLIINCNEHFISYQNQRTNLTYQLNIDLNSCPFPWKLTLGLFHTQGESIRLIS